MNCKYERLGDFCFICGLLSHTERFCKKKFEGDGSTMVRECGSVLRLGETPAEARASGYVLRAVVIGAKNLVVIITPNGIRGNWLRISRK